MYYVYAYDKIWKDWMCCECSTYEEAMFVRDKWESFSDRNRVCIESARNWTIITCRKHLKQFGCSHYCDEHIDTRSNKGKDILKQWRNEDSRLNEGISLV